MRQKAGIPKRALFASSELPLTNPRAWGSQLLHDLDGGLAAGKVFWLDVFCRGGAEANYAKRLAYEGYRPY